MNSAQLHSRLLLLLSALLLLSSCGLSRPLRPLKSGAVAAEFSIPAVLVANDEFGFPVGDLVVGGRYGLSEDQELRLRIHPMPLLVAGVVVLEAGGVWHVQKADGYIPALHIAADLSMMTHPSSWGQSSSEKFRGALAAKAILHFEPLDWLWPYIVYDQAIIFEGLKPVPSLMVGVQFLTQESMEFSVEGGVSGFTERADLYTQPYVSPGDYGVWYLGFGFTWRFESTDEAGPSQKDLLRTQPKLPPPALPTPNLPMKSRL
ncbi:hypothetical protein KAI87_00620 [Myxococcota bacterium]|nr:hypothetical protein [Myxococcota bacterium]